MTLRHLGAAVIACALACSISAADARKAPRHDSTVDSHCVFDNSGHVTCADAAYRIQRAPTGRAHRGEDPRPQAWCGWWLRHELGIADRTLNLARAWARYGTNARTPAVGAIVVWRHHVGIITGRSASGWIVKSGNDGRTVRERERSVARAIAFRWPNGVASR